MALILPVIPAALAFAKLERTLSSNPTAAHAAATDKVCSTLLMSFIPVHAGPFPRTQRNGSEAVSGIIHSWWPSPHLSGLISLASPTLPLLSSWPSPYIAVTIFLALTLYCRYYILSLPHISSLPLIVSLGVILSLLPLIWVLV